MASPSSSENAAASSSAQQLSRRSHMPTRPSSYHFGNERPFAPNIATSTGSPRPSSVIAPQHGVTTLGSPELNRPRVSNTPSLRFPTSRQRPVSAAFALRSPNLPSTMSGRDSPTTQSSSYTDLRAARRTSDSNKALPSRLSMQLTDPQTPPRAQLTLVDAEAGATSQAQESTLLTTDEKGHVQQQQRQTDVNTVTNEAIHGHEANASVNNSHSSSFLARQGSTERSVRRSRHPGRPYTSNYHPSNYHAVSPSARVAVSSPLTGRSMRSNLSVPPGTSSRRMSLPVLGNQQQMMTPRRPMSSFLGNESRSIGYSHDQEIETAQPIALQPSRGGQSPDTSLPTASRAETHNGTNAEQNDRSSIAIAQRTPLARRNGNSESTRPVTRPVTRPWVYDSHTRWRSRQLPYQPTLRIHRTSNAVIYGDPDCMPTDSPDSVPPLMALRRSLGSVAQRTMSAFNMGMGSSANVSDATRTLSTETTSVAIGSTNDMRLARTTSTASLARNFSTPTRAMVRLIPRDNYEIERIAPTSTDGPAPGSDEELINLAQALVQTSPDDLARQRAAELVAARRANNQAQGVRIQSPQPAVTKKDESFSLRAKRSVRNMLAKHEAESTSASKRWIADSGKTLAKRLSRNFSKAHVAEEAQVEEELAEEGLAEEEPKMKVDQVLFPTETMAGLTHIFDETKAEGVRPAERLRSLEIGEAILRVSEIAQQQKISAQKLRAIQRELELGADTMGDGLQHLNNLLRFDFRDETLRAIMDVLRRSRGITETDA
ncbi:hypothetical protein ACEQ8H_002387 [Pleosporales sp. CAS-2024a]